jgi:PAS domain S-box-containing protein
MSKTVSEAGRPRVPAKARRQKVVLEASALQAAIFNSANFSSIATDARGVIQIFNVGAERMLGFAAEEVVNRITPAEISDPQEIIQRAQSLSDEFHTPIAPGFEARVFKASRGIEDVYELTYVCRNGTRLPALVSVTALRDAQESIIGYLLIGTDNTTRKQIEAERTRLHMVLQCANCDLRDAKVKADRANLAKSEFLSSMSHELRSPLNAILGFSQLMDSGLPPPSPAQKESIDQIMQAGWYLLALINEILDLSLIESGKLSLSPESMSLTEVLDDCQAMIEPQAQKSGIRMRFPTNGTPCYIKADRTRVKQVLINLLTNAIKYNSVGGTVDVSCDASVAGRVRVSFRDTGHGLSAEQLAHLFQPFNRLGQEAGAEEGTGIGLVVCKRLVELMGGSIGVESTVGFGSVFWVDLLAAQAPKLAASDEPAGACVPAPMPSGSRRRTLLYVEDNPANLLLVEKLIARRPEVHLLTATDGHRGIEIARATRPDAILMDINLPGISGIDAMKLLANDPVTAQIPVIALSANAMPHDISRGLSAGFFRYLTKPIKVYEFLETLDLALRVRETPPTLEPEMEPE